MILYNVIYNIIHIDFAHTDSVQVDYWIISTDYDHYSLTYGCSARSGDTCLAAHAWIWSRKTTLQSQYYAMTNSSLPQLCLIPSDLIVTDQLKGLVYIINPFNACCEAIFSEFLNIQNQLLL